MAGTERDLKAYAKPIRLPRLSLWRTAPTSCRRIASFERASACRRRGFGLPCGGTVNYATLPTGAVPAPRGIRGLPRK